MAFEEAVRIECLVYYHATESKTTDQPQLYKLSMHVEWRDCPRKCVAF
jgi:hypothetical protein